MLFLMILSLYGSIVGSFAGVCGMRIVQKQSFYTGRSHCDKCQSVLKWYELIPLFSFLYLKGRCRTCQQVIPKEIFVFELFFASFTPFLWLTGNHHWRLLLFQFLLIGLLAVLAYIDIKIQLVPNQVHLWLMCLVLLNYQGIQTHIKGGLLIFVPLFILSWVTAEGMGGGDVKLFGSLGFVLGWKAILLIFSYAVFCSLPIAMYMKFYKGRDGVPFVPFITIGSCLFFLFNGR
ncbi:leader peptidase (prepilin peptidase) / N-methyltransferase [Isobaculum melis]|uniref:Leader peptidase (Prepilin peptidase) / N-methyltransferase n=2 Tax=Isobaculum melis TaxID=142588 RepID=A0A1H9SMY5_9LACT|nr:leader peptidase (prepilin peptidase) / N-methyltransferase [Isobaculum melis]